MPNPTPAGPAKRHALRDHKRWLRDEERRLLDMESCVAESGRALTRAVPLRDIPSAP
jgi:hypothetical protein